MVARRIIGVIFYDMTFIAGGAGDVFVAIAMYCFLYPLNRFAKCEEIKFHGYEKIQHAKLYCVVICTTTKINDLKKKIITRYFRVTSVKKSIQKQKVETTVKNTS